jgi:hypothetical protein
VAYITSGTLTMLQMLRMAQASGCSDTECFLSESDALTWIQRRAAEHKLR